MCPRAFHRRCSAPEKDVSSGSRPETPVAGAGAALAPVKEGKHEGPTELEGAATCERNEVNAFDLDEANRDMFLF